MTEARMVEILRELLDTLERLSRLGCRQSRGLAKVATDLVKSTLKDLDAKDSGV